MIAVLHINKLLQLIQPPKHSQDLSALSCTFVSKFQQEIKNLYLMV